MSHDRMISLSLPDLFVGQLLDGLDVLIEQWENTAEFLMSGDADDIGCIRECSSPEEAVSISEFYRQIRSMIDSQRQNNLL